VSHASRPVHYSVLVVDSDDTRRRGLVRSLAERDCVGYPARTAAGARLLLGSSRFDVILAQMRLEEASGINLVNDVRGWDTEVPIVIWFERMAATGRPEWRAIWFLRQPIDSALLTAIEDGYRAQVERDARRTERMATIPLHPAR
jgi:DNA-binding NtrC family response regulator